METYVSNFVSAIHNVVEEESLESLAEFHTAMLRFNNSFSKSEFSEIGSKDWKTIVEFLLKFDNFFNEKFSTIANAIIDAAFDVDLIQDFFVSNLISFLNEGVGLTQYTNANIKCLNRLKVENVLKIFSTLIQVMNDSNETLVHSLGIYASVCFTNSEIHFHQEKILSLVFSVSELKSRLMLLYLLYKNSAINSSASEDIWETIYVGLFSHCNICVHYSLGLLKLFVNFAPDCEFLANDFNRVSLNTLKGFIQLSDSFNQSASHLIISSHIPLLKDWLNEIQPQNSIWILPLLCFLWQHNNKHVVVEGYKLLTNLNVKSLSCSLTIARLFTFDFFNHLQSGFIFDNRPLLTSIYKFLCSYSQWIIPEFGVQFIFEFLANKMWNGESLLIILAALNFPSVKKCELDRPTIDNIRKLLRIIHLITWHFRMPLYQSLWKVTLVHIDLFSQPANSLLLMRLFFEKVGAKHFAALLADVDNEFLISISSQLFSQIDLNNFDHTSTHDVFSVEFYITVLAFNVECCYTEVNNSLQRITNSEHRNEQYISYFKLCSISNIFSERIDHFYDEKLRSCSNSLFDVLVELLHDNILSFSPSNEVIVLRLLDYTGLLSSGDISSWLKCHSQSATNPISSIVSVLLLANINVEIFKKLPKNVFATFELLVELTEYIERSIRSFLSQWYVAIYNLFSRLATYFKIDFSEDFSNSILDISLFIHTLPCSAAIAIINSVSTLVKNGVLSISFSMEVLTNAQKLFIIQKRDFDIKLFKSFLTFYFEFLFQTNNMFKTETSLVLNDLFYSFSESITSPELKYIFYDEVFYEFSKVDDIVSIFNVYNKNFLVAYLDTSFNYDYLQRIKNVQSNLKDLSWDFHVPSYSNLKTHFLLLIFKFIEKTSAPRAYLTQLLIEDENVVKSYGALRQQRNSTLHRKRFRLWQLITVLIHRILLSDVENEELMQVCETLTNNVKLDCDQSIRFLVDICVSRIIINMNSISRQEFVSGMINELSKKSSQTVCSRLNILCLVIIDIQDPSDRLDFAMRYFSFFFNWLTVSHATINAVAQLSVIKLWTFFNHSNLYSPIIEKHKDMSSFIDFCMENHKSTNKLSKFNDFSYSLVYSSRLLFSLETILIDYPVHFDIHLDEVIDDISVFQSIDFINTRNHCKENPFSKIDVFHRYVKDRLVAKTIKQNSLSQQKIVPNKDMVVSDGNITLSKSNLVVVASFLQKPTNIGGLCRTCEILNVEALVVSNIRSLTTNNDFTQLSVSSEKWTPLLEVPVNSMSDYLIAMRSKGYLLVGLEQASRSTMLHEYTFPEKCLIVLGNEREGIPCDFLHMLDKCLEIPQFGMIRSLNVHVAASLVIWEYCKQHNFKPK